MLGRSQAHGMGNLLRRKQVNRLAWLEAGLKDGAFKSLAEKNVHTNSGLANCSSGSFWVLNDYVAKLVFSVEIQKNKVTHTHISFVFYQLVIIEIGM